MNILILGDIIGDSGCEFLLNSLDKYKMDNNIDLIIANGENSAEPNGISRKSAKLMLSSGVDVITTGNHVFRQPDYKLVFSDFQQVIRPANFYKDVPGSGYHYISLKNKKVCVINISGSNFMPISANDPFECLDNLLSKLDADIFIIDVHAEATAEKLCIAHYLDSKVTAIVGTHTHVQTADEQILPGGTAYITDLGMVGPAYSILGKDVSSAIFKMQTGLPVKITAAADNNILMCGVIINIEDNTNKVTNIKRVTTRSPI